VTGGVGLPIVESTEGAAGAGDMSAVMGVCGSTKVQQRQSPTIPPSSNTGTSTEV